MRACRVRLDSAPSISARLYNSLLAATVENSDKIDGKVFLGLSLDVSKP